MHLLIFGFLLLSFPPIIFTIVNKNKYIGFANGLIFVISFHIALALLSQSLHLFTYPVVIVASSITNVVLLFIFQKRIRQINFSFPSEFFKKFDWMLPLVLVLSLFCLYQVHYNYTGKVTSLSQDVKQVKNLEYPYPYYADEWYAIAFIKESLKTHSLPFKNPFFLNESFVNFEFISHSFLSELMLMMRLNPLLDYTKLTIGFNVLIILLIYLFLRYFRVPSLTSGIASLSALFITHGSNLPGIWVLFPLTTGLIPLLLSLFYFLQKNVKMIFITSFLSLILYPPLFVVFAPAFLFFSLENQKDVKENSKTIFFRFIFVVLTSGIIVSFAILYDSSEWFRFIPLIATKLFYESFITTAIPKYAIWNVLPWPVLLFGLWALFKPGSNIRWLKSTVIVGLLYWLVYSFIMYRFIIDYQRVVYLTAMLLVIMGGIGFHQFNEFVDKNNFVRKYKIMRCLQLGICAFIIAISFRYTTLGKWEKLNLYHYGHKKIFAPAPPANTYLTNDDLRIFKNIHSEIFLSPPWKGTVIGVATDNYPRCTKPGTISIAKKRFENFVLSDCAKKQSFAKIWKIKYFYTLKFDCPNFVLKDKSREGLYLYEYKAQ